jgi:predicted RNA-binding Zn ribbon-like protein
MPQGRVSHADVIIAITMTESRDAELHHLIGGALCLDFANTLYGHAVTIHEYLFDYRDLVLWTRHVGSLSPERADALFVAWKRYPKKTATVFHQAIQLREILYRIFSSLSQNESPSEKDISFLDSAWLESQTHSRLVRTESGFTLGWKHGDAIDSMLWPIAVSAVDLLTSQDLKRVKQCGRCDWLFLDQSRNLSRQWCSMSACGNRIKMARRYQREKGRDQPHIRS